MNASRKGRTDSASRVIAARPEAIYKAFLDPDAWIEWVPPKGMRGWMHKFEPRVGGAYRMSLTHVDPSHSVAGKSSEHTDIVRGRFIELVPNERIVQVTEFESENPAFAGTMTMTWSLAAHAGGTRVTILCENVPEGIRQQDHDAGLKSTLENLAAYTE